MGSAENRPTSKARASECVSSILGDKGKKSY